MNAEIWPSFCGLESHLFFFIRVLIKKKFDHNMLQHMQFNNAADWCENYKRNAIFCRDGSCVNALVKNPRPLSLPSSFTYCNWID